MMKTPQKQLERKATFYRICIENNICVKCGNADPVEGRRMCEPCAKIEAMRQTKRRAKAKAENRCIDCQKAKPIVAGGRCEECRKRSNSYGVKWRDSKAAQGICVGCREKKELATEHRCRECADALNLTTQFKRYRKLVDRS